MNVLDNELELAGLGTADWGTLATATKKTKFVVAEYFCFLDLHVGNDKIKNKNLVSVIMLNTLRERT